MRQISELNDKATLGTSMLGFAQKYRSLIVPLPGVLADTVIQLSPIVYLSDKVLPLKSYYNFIQDIQRTNYLASALAKELASSDDEALVLEGELKAKGSGFLVGSLAEIARKKNGDTGINDKRYEQSISQDAQRTLCTEDVFMLACAFLEVEIAKQGSVYYLKGESPDFKETKKNRNPLNLQDERVLKNLASGLGRPDSERGAVERGQIDSGFNHVVRLNALYNTMTNAIKWIREGERDNKLRRKIDVRSKFGLSHTDYERMMSMARREGQISFRNRKKDPANKYALRGNNHEKVTSLAAKMGFTPQKMLNIILTDFFELTEKQNKKNRNRRASLGDDDE